MRLPEENLKTSHFYYWYKLYDGSDNVHFIYRGTLFEPMQKKEKSKRIGKQYQPKLLILSFNTIDE